MTVLCLNTCQRLGASREQTSQDGTRSRITRGWRGHHDSAAGHPSGLEAGRARKCPLWSYTAQHTRGTRPGRGREGGACSQSTRETSKATAGRWPGRGDRNVVPGLDLQNLLLLLCQEHDPVPGSVVATYIRCSQTPTGSEAAHPTSWSRGRASTRGPTEPGARAPPLPPLRGGLEGTLPSRSLCVLIGTQACLGFCTGSCSDRTRKDLRGKSPHGT